ncbi:MAG: hypothetical protein U9N56_12105 [Actinomycetota bacterium]|nr:hypothetical protein [Actinomycetota bacterium]
MPEEQTVPTHTEVRRARARPLTGAILGILIGLAVAVVLQQQGIWPLDKILVFLLPAATGVIGLVLTSVSRAAAPGPMILAFIILIPMAAWGATGLSTTNEVGVLNGGCEVFAVSDMDDTVVTDTSKQDPFEIDPNGGLTWVATSPVVFDDYPWKIWVEIGGARITLDSEEAQDNDAGSQVNDGDVANVEAYAAERGIDISQLRGVYKVGGDAANTCDGFGFVKLIADPLETILAKIAAGLAVLLTLILLVIAFTGRTRPVAVPDTADGIDGDLGSDVSGPANGSGAAGAAGAVGAAGAASATAVGDENGADSDEPGDDEGPGDSDEDGDAQ